MQNKLKMQQILAAIGSRSLPNETDDIAHDVHDWHQVRYFDTSQLQAIEDLGGKVAPLFSTVFQRAFGQEFCVELTQIHQTITSQYKEGTFESDAFLAYQTEDASMLGSLTLPTATSKNMITRLLGESGDAEETQTLSQLERTLLSDVAVSLVEAFSSCCPNDFQAQSPLTVGHMAAPLEDTEELCTLNFTFKEGEASEETGLEFVVVMPCSHLAQALEDVVKPVAASENELSIAMHGHVNSVPVQITAEFASTQLTLEQAMDLNVGDVLLLDKDLNDPLTLKINDRRILYGKPVQCDNHYAMVVTQNVES